MTGACDYCGLPAGGSAGGGPLFCCSGCRFAASITGASGDDARARWMMTRLGLAIFFTMNVMVFTMLLWSQHDGPPAGPAAAAFYGLARHACLLFTGPVLLLLGGPLLDESLAELRRGRASLNLLLLTGVAAAFAISVWATWHGDGHVYYEVACMVLVAVTLGRWLEASGKLRTTAALRELRTLLPDRVRRVEGTTAGGRSTREVPLADVIVGDRLRILPGEHLPTDGRIVAGEAAIDERTVTGESEPVLKRAGSVVQGGVHSIVYSGTCNLDGDLVVEVTAAPGAGTLERLIAAVEAAAGGGRQRRLAERLSAWFLPLVLAVAAVTTVVHWRRAGPGAGVLTGLAVVVVSCPCALGLATPLALWAAIGAATRRHVLIRDGDALDRLARADLVCFDKTGTITTGCRVTDIAVMHTGMTGPPADVGGGLVAVAAALAAGSTHVHATAILAAAAAECVGPAAVAGIRSVAGCGVEGRLDDGRTVRLGSPHWTGWQPTAGDGGEPPRVVLAVGGEPRVAFWIAEEVRPEAGPAIAALAAAGCAARMLSGDRAERAREVAEPLGLDWEAPLLPAEKLAAIERLTAAGRHVVMVGDGINDAPALAVADVGVALGCGADVSRWTAAVCLLRDDLSALPWLVRLGRRTRRTIRWNLLWAFGYNAACIPLAAAGLVHPAVAAAAMVASSLLVVGNSLRLGSGAEADGPVAAAPGFEPARPRMTEVAA